MKRIAHGDWSTGLGTCLMAGPQVCIIRAQGRDAPKGKWVTSDNSLIGQTEARLEAKNTFFLSILKYLQLVESEPGGKGGLQVNFGQSLMKDSFTKLFKKQPTTPACGITFIAHIFRSTSKYTSILK